MNSFSNLRWAAVERGRAPTSPVRATREWANVRKLLNALERERGALENTRRGMAAPVQLFVAPRDYEIVRRERRLSRRMSNLKWMCMGGGICWIAFLLLI